MATQPLGTPRFRALDSSGNPLSAGKLYSYEAGTSTPLATYTTRAGDVANANPVVLNSNGEADVWMTPGVLYKFALYTSADVLQWTVDNFPSPAEESVTDLVTTDPGGRLTVSSGLPVSITLAAQTTIYYAPYRHNQVSLYDGTGWALHEFSELSQADSDDTKSPAAAASDNSYDMFVWLDDSVLRCTRGPAWSSDTSRGTGAGTTELERVNGRLVNAVSITNGPTAQRGLYVGTVRLTGSGFIDEPRFRYVWNMYNRVHRSLGARLETTDAWSYNTATIRQANASTANMSRFVRGLDEDAARADLSAIVDVTVAGTAYVGIGLDSTSTFTIGALVPGISGRTSGGTGVQVLRASWAGMPGLGYHYLSWNERGDGAGTFSWKGDAGDPTLMASGMVGDCMA